MSKRRVMLIDDEAAIRNTIKQSVDWDEFNMEVVGEADSGSEAINVIDGLLPDLLFVDIKMPFLNGVEFSKIIAKRYKHIKILIVTAYSDFNYAKECIEISNIIGYLLKPIDINEIKNHLRTIEFDKEQEPEAIGDFSDEDTDLHVRIKKFIEENYANTYLNVGAIAEQFGYNASYVSSYYKRETGISLSDEIFRYRMEQAVRYKKSGLKMYLVAQKVGIADPYYFSKCFKKYTGSSFKTYEDK